MGIFNFNFTSLKILEENIKKCSRVSLDDEQKTKMKNRIMGTINQHSAANFGFDILVNEIKRIALGIIPSASFRSLLKEKLIAIIEFNPSRFFGFQNFIVRYRKALVYAFTAIFLFTVVFNFAMKTQRVEASFVTVLEGINGDVTVIRDTEEMPGTPGLLLKSDDVVRTGPSSNVVIRFLDQSISRLDENTEVKISKLFINPFNKTETVIELILNKGQLWSRVVNLINDLSRFQVKAENTMAVVKKKAAFNVTVSPKNKAKISAVQNKVDVVVALDKKTVETTLVKGFSAEVQTGVVAKPQIAEQQIKEDKEQKWVADNLEKDKAYIEGVKQDAEDQGLTQIKTAADQLSMPLLADELEKHKKDFDASQKKIADAGMLIRAGRVDQAKTLLADALAQLKNIFAWLQEYKTAHPVEASVFKSQIDETLNSYEKQLALVLPNEFLYLVKDTVAQARVAVASDAGEIMREKLSIAEDKLSEAHDLVEQGNDNAAIEQVEAYNQTMAEVVSDIQQLPDDKKEEAVTAVLDNKLEGLKSLEVINQTAPPSDVSEQSPQMKETVSVAKEQALTQIGEVVVTASELSPGIEVKQKLQDLNQVDVNGKKLLDVKFTENAVTIRAEDMKISVEKTRPAAPETNSVITQPAATDLKTLELPQAQP